MISIKPRLGSWVFFLTAVSASLTSAQPKHPHLFFDQQGMESLRNRVATNPRLHALWAGFKEQRVDSSFRVNVTAGGGSGNGRFKTDRLARQGRFWAPGE